MESPARPKSLTMDEEDDAPAQDNRKSTMSMHQSKKRTIERLDDDGDSPPPQDSTQPTLDIGNGICIPWYTNDKNKLYSWDGGTDWDVVKTTGIIKNVLSNRDGSSKTFELRSGLLKTGVRYNAQLSHSVSVKTGGVHKFLFTIQFIPISGDYTTSPSSISIGIENSTADLYVWQLTSGNKFGYLPELEDKPRELDVLNRHMIHFLRLLLWVNSAIPQSANLKDNSISFIKMIRFYIETPKEKGFAQLLKNIREGTVWRAQSKGKSEKWIDCDLKNFS
jgi:hypothetical protein